MGKSKRTIDSFFKRIEDVCDPQLHSVTDNTKEDDHNTHPQHDGNRERPSILSYPSNQRDEIRRLYIKLGPYQLQKSKYPFSPSGRSGSMRSFQQAWVKNFWWLEYSEKKDVAFCFPCFLFNKKPIGKVGSDTFTVSGFNRWKKVNCGKDCAFIVHEGKTPASAHNFSVRCYEDLKNQLCHIENVIEKQTTQQVMDNRLRLKVSIVAIKWLTFQGCALRGHDERPNSRNQGNFLELIKFLASYNKTVADVVLENAPQNAKYTSPDIQKEILSVLATNVQKTIRDEIGMSKFCLIVNESQDESKKEQMAIVVRFVDQDGNVKERFLDLIHVKDTTSLTLKNEILCSLSYHKLSVQDIRGQGYDGASNMRGEWNGFQALLLKECPYAYYIHCLSHQLQLALVAASKDVSEVHNFFKTLNFVVNVISSSSKRNDQLQDAQIAEISHLTEVGELESGKGTNQIRTLQRPGDTRWSSHFKAICSLIRLFGPSCAVLNDIALKGSTSSQRGDAAYALTHALSFDFVIVMHMMKEIMGITDKLCQTLQQKSIDIVNALALVSTTKILIQKLRDEGWQSLLDQVVCFCEKNNIPVPNMNEAYRYIIRQRREKDNITTEHHYRVELFIVAIDSQLQELNSRFNESATELLRLSVMLDPRKSLNVEDICKLATSYYPMDFTERERSLLKLELKHYEIDVQNHPQLKNSSTISELCRGLHEKRKSSTYPLLDKLIRLILTLPVSTTTSERAFSAMKLLKTRLRNTMSDDFLKSCLLVNIEREIADTFPTDEIIDYFYSMKQRRAQLKVHKVNG
ncbi:uncharacterized protein LOC111889415 [Lactuca sativa]|uniref:uncharacterized protein LOC111889415 n=1 Tax=Lactuca sativa TaxID=4236 RepID=UPI0022AF22F9|nr:uncharacterized protein LOC111889415 [Lactuca sativa]